MRSSCRDCGTAVCWATTVGGFRKKFDLKPDPDGEWVLNYEQARYRDGQIVPERWTASWVSAEFRERAFELHASHDEKCAPITIRGAA